MGEKIVLSDVHKPNGTCMTGPCCVILKRSGAGWECVVLYEGPFGGFARKASWARSRATLMGDVRAVLR